jgi:hypothetical protein
LVALPKLSQKQQEPSLEERRKELANWPED